ncbi:transglycosylase SLT domain-containing protein [Nocardia macrotermitis]|uniref:transglycosylase SLT domain-containing protein n=1 Tax=Nocardia macrotermitis TaxID=2585198 RepID=UPI0029E7DF9C|nr:transglycosylase SLT domain-containing protein [Nocardia macrotermitis]
MSSTATVKHYKPVDLNKHCPPKASPGLRGLIKTAQETIQTSVDLLGSGQTDDVPDLVKLLSDKKLATVTDGKAQMVDNYSTKMSDLDEIKSTIHEQDTGVKSSAYDTGGIAAETWKEIEKTIQQLTGTLDSAHDWQPAKGSTYLSAAREAPLTKAVLSAVVSVHDEIQIANDQIQSQADKVGGSQAPYVPTSYSSGGGGGGGGSYVPVNGSGGYDSKYTQPVSSSGGSTAHHRLSRTELEEYIGKALDALGITDPTARKNWTEGYLTLIQRESGGDVGSINLTDSNAAAGHPSQGLTQTIPGTFGAYHVSGTSSSITDPTANIAASMNYVMHRYHVSRDGSNLTSNVQQADANRAPLGY